MLVTITHIIITLINPSIMTGSNLVRLVSTPLSHFGRKPRILLDLYKVPYQFVDVGNVALTKKPTETGGHPLMKVPVLEHGKTWMIESDHISGYIVDQFDTSKQDIYKVWTKDIFDLNARAMMNGIMTDEVKVIAAGRHQVPIQNYTYFNKCYESVKLGMQWLEDHHQQMSSTVKKPTYRDFHLVCLWEHLAYVDFIPLTPYPHLQDIVKKVNEACPTLHLTAPMVVKPK